MPQPGVATAVRGQGRGHREELNPATTVPDVSAPPSPRGSGSDVDAQAPNGDRLANLLLGIARYVDPATAPSIAAPSGDPSLDAVRHILLDRELQVLARLR